VRRLLTVAVVLVGCAVLYAAPSPEDKVADYVKALKSKDPAVRRLVAAALAEMGDKAKAAVPALREARMDPDETVQSAAAAALDRIAPVGRSFDDERRKRIQEDLDKAIPIRVPPEQLLEEMAKELEKLKRAPQPEKEPPSNDVEGFVRKTDEKTREVTVSVGSDAGVVKGQTLEVYRLQPTPTYLGRIRLTHVRPNEAVGKPVSRLLGPVMQGDLVAAKIPGN
jgi:hypothetical protein